MYKQETKQTFHIISLGFLNLQKVTIFLDKKDKKHAQL